MKLKVDPILGAAVVLLVGLVAYNQSRSPDNEDNLEIRSFWCLGVCAKLDGHHHSPEAGKKDEPAQAE